MAELILDEAVTTVDFLRRDGLDASRAGKGVDGGAHGGGGEVEHALLGADEVAGRGGGGVES